MNGVPELLILRRLAEDEMYGYELVRPIHARSKGEFRLRDLITSILERPSLA